MSPPLVVVADHPEAAHDAVVTEYAIAVETEFAAVAMGHHAEGLTAGSHGGDWRASVAVETSEDFDGPPAFIADIEAFRAPSVGRGDAPLDEGGVRTLVDEDPSGSPVAVTVSTAAVTSTAAIVSTAAVTPTAAIVSTAAVTSAVTIASTAVAAPVSVSAPVLGARRSRGSGRSRGCGVMPGPGDMVGRSGGVVEWLGCPVDRRGSRGGLDGRGIGDAGGCKDRRAYSGADQSESTRGHGHFSLFVRASAGRPTCDERTDSSHNRHSVHI
ncbi:hypothetical protein ACWC2T_30130 [Streptomyces sp. NPDC001393]